jgi:hypothetical protein
MSDDGTGRVESADGTAVGCGPHGRRYGARREVEDLQAVAAVGGATRTFGLSSGALASLRTALCTPELTQGGPVRPVDEVPPPHESLALFGRIGQPLDEAHAPARRAHAHSATGAPAGRRGRRAGCRDAGRVPGPPLPGTVNTYIG